MGDGRREGGLGDGKMGGIGGGRVGGWGMEEGRVWKKVGGGDRGEKKATSGEVALNDRLKVCFPAGWKACVTRGCLQHSVRGKLA